MVESAGGGKSPKIISAPAEMLRLRRAINEQSIGFVPTMGALHQGHCQLIRHSLKQNQITVVSIFINPTQFNDPKDLKNYPRTWDSDLAMLSELGVDLLFAPQYADLYPDNYRYMISEKELSQRFCGAHRPGHFNGMLTVVMKLLQIVRPNRAYFGEKDYQQLQLVKGMAEAFFLDCQIQAVPTLREEGGLAMSSRNELLSPDEREVARSFNKILRESKSPEEAIQILNESGFKVDYVEDWDNRRLAAVHLGSVRLIDNVTI